MKHVNRKEGKNLLTKLFARNKESNLDDRIQRLSEEIASFDTHQYDADLIKLISLVDKSNETPFDAVIEKFSNELDITDDSERRENLVKMIKALSEGREKFLSQEEDIPSRIKVLNESKDILIKDRQGLIDELEILENCRMNDCRHSTMSEAERSAIIAVLGNLILAILFLNYEKMGVITTKAVSLLFKHKI